MAQYPIKMLKDENGTPFVPLVAPEAVKDTQGTNWQTLIDKKLEKTNIIAGDNITLSVSGNDITINSQAGGASDYSDLTNKPKINNVELSGNKSSSDLGITNLNNVLDGNAIGSARTIGAKDSEGQPLGEYAWAEGQDTIASGLRCHAEGWNTKASNDDSHAEGHNTVASGYYSHAEGLNTAAPGYCSHAEGRNTTASGSNQHVQGKNNVRDTTLAHIVGNGSSDSNKSNAHTLDWQGNAWFAGDVYTGSTSGKNKDDGSKKLATEDMVNTSLSSKQDILVSGTNIKTINNESILGEGNISISGGSSLNNVLDGNAIGSARTIGANDSEGKPLGIYAWAEGQDTIASGDRSHAEGMSTRASGYISHAEGMGTKALGDYSHAEGSQTEASGNNSHAEGIRTTASSSSSHAEGDSTIASGNFSHAEGYDTKAQGNNQHVQGKYNIADTTSAHIVGNGTKYNARSNAHTLDWSGNAWFAGDVYTGSTSGTNKDDGSKKLATEEFVTNLVGNVESGSNSEGSWIKYSDGSMICYKTIIATGINVDNPWGNLYENSSAIQLGNFAQTFKERPIVSLNKSSGQGCWVQVHDNISTTSAGRCYVASATSRSNASLTFEIIAIGKWK